jgi:3',5'-cyclic AMP phosphodiesterase CpdA
MGSGILSSASTIERVAENPIRFAHLSDIHVKPGIDPERGMAKAFRHVQSLKNPVSFIINGGDAIMDALEADKQKTQQQWDVFNQILKAENSLPIYHTIGNHDVWGWFNKEVNKDEPLYGKKWAQEELKLKERYYSFTKGKWHFIVLDSTQLNPAGGYIARVDESQLAWLEAELEKVPSSQFICIVSHIPILSICAGLFFNKNEANGDLKIQRNLMHSDFFQLKQLFLKHPNIKVCIGGHIHLQDELEYLGVKYYCNGAVSGGWWKGPYQEFEPAYAVMELFNDGLSKRTMVNYQS